jgi:PKD repeat protein
LKTPTSIAFYSKIGNGEYAIQALGELNTDKLIPLGIETPTSGNQTIALKNTENFDGTSQVILEDIKLGIFHNLKNAEYSYQFDVAIDVNRFRLHIKPAVTVATTAESCVQNDATLTIQSPSNTAWDYQVKNSQNMTVASGNQFTGMVEVPHLSGGNYSINLSNILGSFVTIPVSIAAGSPVSASITASATSVEANNNYVTFSAQVNGATDFTWNFGDGTIVSGTTNPSHVFTQPGTYEVTFIASNAYCIDSKSVTIVVKNSSTLGVSQIESKASFGLYPNPVIDLANIQLNMPQNEEKIVVYVLDGSGKLVKTENFSRVDKKSSIQINVSELANGVYQLMIQGKHFSANTKLNIVR